MRPPVRPSVLVDQSAPSRLTPSLGTVNSVIVVKSAPPPEPAPRHGLTWRDLGVLVVLCTLLYGYRLVHQRVLSTHEAVHCENVREMFLSHDWIIPSYGDRPWLERPPLPHWITGSAASLVGGLEEAWALRLGSILAGLLAVLLTARMAGLWYGRAAGLLAGAILATMREFADYATGPEADIFLCAMVTAAHALLVRLEFQKRLTENGPRGGILGRRSWAMAGFFAILGLTNLTKGPFFGMLFVCAPLAGYFLANLDWAGARRYVWLWGGLIFAVAGGTWYAAALWRYPDMVDLWNRTYTSRMDTGYLGEPVWYYLVSQPWNAFPWLLPLGAGLVLTARRALRVPHSPERYLWCWAALPLLVLSLPQAKHHHYLLPCLPPLAMLASLGAMRLWRWLSERPAWIREPWLATLVFGAVADAALVRFGARIPGPEWVRSALLVGVPAGIFLFWYAAGRRNGLHAAVAVIALVCLGQCLVHAHQAEYLDNYAQDSAFLEEAMQRTPAENPVIVVNDTHPLNASWFLFYLHGRGRLIHNLTFLCSEELAGPDAYVLTRTADQAKLAEYGAAELLVQSRHTRGESSPEDRWALFRVHFHPGLRRVAGNVYISPAQAAGLVSGPYLGEK